MKKSVLKNLAAGLLALAMILGTAGCDGTSKESSAGSSAPVSSNVSQAASTPESGGTDEKVEITGIIMEGTQTTVDINDLPIWDFAEEATGVRVDWELLPQVSMAEKLSLKFSTNDLPDLVFKCIIDAGDITKYANDGMLVPIEDYLKDPAVAPNFSALMKSNETIEKQIRSADGHLYGFPYLVTASPSNVSPKLFANEKWLEAQNLSIPTTTDELYEVLKAMKDYDYNGNGENDEIPLFSESWTKVQQALMGSFGLGTRGGGSLNWDIDPNTGKLRFIQTSDGYKEFLQYVNKLYTEKLLDQEVITTDATRLMAQAEQNTLGLVFCHNDSYMGTYTADFTGFPGALTGPHGDNLYCGVTSPVAGCYAWITNKNQHVEDTVRFVDYFYSEEGILHYFMGVEGETFEFDEEGLPQFTELVTDNPDGLSREEVLARYTIWGGGANPSVADDIHFGNHLIDETTVNAAVALRATEPEEIWGAFNYATEDAEMVTIYQMDIITYCDDMTAKFVTGEVSFDQWDDYVATVEKMDLAGYYEVVQRALDNYNSAS